MELNWPITILVGCANPCSYIFREVHAGLRRRVQMGLQLCRRLQCRFPVTMAILLLAHLFVTDVLRSKPEISYLQKHSHFLLYAALRDRP